MNATARLVGLVIGSRASALLYVVPCAPLPHLSVLSASPPDSERVPKLDRGGGRAQGEAGGERCPSTLAGKLKSAPSPGSAEIRSESGG